MFLFYFYWHQMIIISLKHSFYSMLNNGKLDCLLTSSDLYIWIHCVVLNINGLNNIFFIFFLLFDECHLIYRQCALNPITIFNWCIRSFPWPFFVSLHNLIYSTFKTNREIINTRCMLQCICEKFTVECLLRFDF